MNASAGNNVFQQLIFRIQRLHYTGIAGISFTGYRLLAPVSHGPNQPDAQQYKDRAYYYRFYAE